MLFVLCKALEKGKAKKVVLTGTDDLCKLQGGDESLFYRQVIIGASASVVRAICARCVNSAVGRDIFFGDCRKEEKGQAGAGWRIRPRETLFKEHGI